MSGGYSNEAIMLQNLSRQSKESSGESRESMMSDSRLSTLSTPEGLSRSFHMSDQSLQARDLLPDSAGISIAHESIELIGTIFRVVAY